MSGRIVSVLGLAISVVLLISPAAHAFPIYGILQWQDTGISLVEGGTYRVLASDYVASTWPIDDWRFWHDADGQDLIGNPVIPNAPSDFLAPGLACWSLVGRVNVGTPFQLGVDVTFLAPASGSLEMANNDNWYPDNGRSYEVTVQAIPEPGAALLLLTGCLALRRRRLASR